MRSRRYAESCNPATSILEVIPKKFKSADCIRLGATLIYDRSNAVAHHISGAWPCKSPVNFWRS